MARRRIISPQPAPNPAPIDDDTDDDELDELDDDDDDDDTDDDELDDLDADDDQDEAAPTVQVKPSQVRAAVAARHDAWSPPKGAAYVCLFRVDPAGRRQKCSVRDPRTGIVHDKLPLPLEAAQVLELWGSGTFALQYHKPDGRLAGSPGPVQLEHEAHPAKPLQATLGGVAPEAPAPAPQPARVEPPPPPPRPVLPAMPPVPSGLDIASFVALQEFFRASAQADADARIARMEREYELRSARVQQEAALEAERQRTRYQLDVAEADERHRRALEHVQAISQDLVNSSRAALNVGPLKRRLEDLESALDERSQGGLAEQLAPLLAPVLQQVLGQRAQTAPVAQIHGDKAQ
jgi:hypothetical protein